MLVAAPDPRSPTGSSAARTCRSRSGCSAGARRSVLVASFVGLAILWPKPRLEGAPERRVGGVPRQLDPIAGAIGIALFVLVVYAGFAGSQTTTNNLAPTVIFVLFWVARPDRQPALRRRLQGDQPVARRGPRGRLAGREGQPRRAARADALSRQARPLARGDRHPRLRLGRARLLRPRRPEQPRGARARLRGRPVRRHEPLRHRVLEPLRRRLRRVLRAHRADVAAALVARRRCSCASR